MKITSAEAAKLLKKLKEQLNDSLNHEQLSREFTASLGENPDAVRPEYDYAAEQKYQAEIEGRIRAVRHAISMFNLNCEVSGFNMTVDQMLVYIPQLTEKKNKLAEMANKLPKQRKEGSFGTAGIVDYIYANYDPKRVQEDYRAVSDELAKAQTALDLLNSTELLEVPEA